MNEFLVIFAIVVAGLFVASICKPYPFDALLKLKIRAAARFARDHHNADDLADWRWQEFREALVFWFNYCKRYSDGADAQYHEVFVLNTVGEAVDIVPPAVLLQKAIHLGLIRATDGAARTIPPAAGMRSRAW